MPPLEPPDPPLTDGVVVVRGIRDTDADALVDALRDPDIVRWTLVPPDYTHADFEAFRARTAAQSAAGEGISLLVVDAADDDRILGSVGLHEADSERPDIGYWVHRDARGRGVAPRAARLLRNWAAEHLGVGRVEILVHPDNEPSQRAAQKAGFTRTGEYRPSPRGEGGGPQLVVFAWPDDGVAGGGAG